MTNNKTRQQRAVPPPTHLAGPTGRLGALPAVAAELQVVPIGIIGKTPLPGSADRTTCLASNADGGGNEDSAVNNCTRGDRNALGVDADGGVELEIRLAGRTRTSSLYPTDTMTIGESLSATAPLHYKRTRVISRDRHELEPPNLDGSFTNRKVDSAIGPSCQTASSPTAYGGFSQGDRAPTPLQFGCADPFLDQNDEHLAGEATDAFGTRRAFSGSGTVAGHAAADVEAECAAGDGWTLFGRVDNLFDHEYATAGALASNPFDAAGTLLTDSEAWRDQQCVAPGAPQAAFVGPRCRLGG